MGQTATCDVEVDGKRHRGEALLETAELILRGPVRLRVPFAAMKRIDVDDGALRIACKSGEVSTLVLALGPRAQVWADKIKNPPGRMDKLGVKPGMKVAVWGPLEPAALDELRARVGGAVLVGKPRGGEALVFVAVDETAQLARIAEAAGKMAPDGAVWVIRRKGKDAAVTEAQSMAAGRAAGLFDTKVVGFSPTHTAERYVIPVTARPAKTTAAKQSRPAAKPRTAPKSPTTRSTPAKARRR